VRIYLAITDNDWFHFLRCQPNLDEVNFWPPGRRFQALSPGEPLLFKLHSPENCITGGGFFAHFSVLPYGLAWDAFGTKNGASSAVEMRRRIERFHHPVPRSSEDYPVGCIILHSPFFFDEADWIPAPQDFHPNTSHGKTYDSRSAAGRSLWEAVQARLRASEPRPETDAQSDMFAEPLQMHLALGLGTFRVLITDIYQRRCAVTGEPLLPVLEPAHIRPPEQGGAHRIDNGLLLRSDIHRLFRRGYLTVDPEHRVRVSLRLGEQRDAGDAYRQLEGREIWLPAEASHRPRREYLEWHVETVFRE
jgi:putative restriction endonuclease